MKKLLLLTFVCISMNAMQDPLQDGVSSLSLENCGGSDLTVVNAARISYKGHSEELNDDDVRLLESMIKNGHKTPFEQTFMQFLVKAPIFVTRQWMRHRVGVSYNELSARYTKMDQEFYMPKHIADCEVMHKQYAKTLDACSLTYQQLLNSGIKREEARCILPVSLYTTFYFSCNLNSLFHFAELRFNSHAQWEIQQYAKAMLLLAQKQFPNSIDLWCKNRNLIIN